VTAAQRWCSEAGSVSLLYGVELAGTRSTSYLNTQGDAGLPRRVLASPLGLVFWLVARTAIVKWYDRKRFYRMHPDVLTYVSHYVTTRTSRALRGCPRLTRVDPDTYGMVLRVEPGVIPIGAGSRRRQS
jgi:hypothetical protein